MPFYPGPGVGGHCIPVDPYYLAWKAREYDFSTKFIEVAAEINQDMPFFTVEKLRRELRSHGKPLLGSTVLVLGAAFKKDIDDARNSSAIRVIEILRKEGARVEYHDPYVPSIGLGGALYGQGDEGVRLTSTELTDVAIERADVVAILVAHSTVPYETILRKASLVFDAVNATASLPPGRAEVVRL
jgi:UDP-N-acetyl-D-glucosamine dehydrogenase